MKQGNIDYNFGRILRVVFWKPGIQRGRRYGAGTAQDQTYTLEFCPQYDSSLTPRMEVTVTDLPSAAKDDKPGYTGKIVIYNPNKDLLEMIAQNSKWLFTEDQLKRLKGAGDKAVEGAVKSNIKDYYDNRLQVTVYAGYWQGVQENELAGSAVGQAAKEHIESWKTGKAGVPPAVLGYTEIFHGYVNETRHFRKGQDAILVVNAHDIDMNSTSTKSSTRLASQIVQGGTKEADIQGLRSAESLQGYGTWDKTFKKFAILLAPDGETYRNENGQAVKNYTREASSADAVRLFDQYCRVYYVKSRNAFENAHIKKLSDVNQTSGVIYEELKQNLTTNTSTLTYNGYNWGLITPKEQKAKRATGETALPNWLNYHGNKYTRDANLQDLCSWAGLQLEFYRLPNMIENKVIYLVYPVGRTSEFVLPDQAEIQIFNYQNLLETPTAGGNGSLTVRMMFNPECKCWRRLSLRLSESLGREQGFADVASFEGAKANPNGDIIGSIGGSSNVGNFFAIQQLSGHIAVAAQAKQQADAKTMGYLFNVGFPITKVVHSLMTHGNDWSTTVITMPVIGGVKKE